MTSKQSNDVYQFVTLILVHLYVIFAQIYVFFQVLQTQIAQLDQIKGNIEGSRDIEYRRRMDDLESELRNLEVYINILKYRTTC